MKITSHEFSDGEMIPQKYTCEGENISPPLEISHLPENTRSLALIVQDDDAQVLGGWTHWVVFNIDPEEIVLTGNSKFKTGTEGLTSFGHPGWGGPCPPSGTHHYEFRLYALDELLDLGPNTNKEQLEEAMKGHVLEQVTLVGLYQKQNQ